MELCDEFRLREHRAKRGRCPEHKVRDLGYVWDPEADAARDVPDPAHTVRLMAGERIVVAEGPERGVKVMRLGDLLDDAIEVMRAACTP